MPIANASFPLGATFAASGGTSTSIKTKTNVDKHVVYVDDGSSLKDQKTVEFSTRESKPSVGSPDGFTQARNHAFIKVPRTLSNGARTFDTLRIELSRSVEATDTDVIGILELGMHVINDPELLEFWLEQSRA